MRIAWIVFLSLVSFAQLAAQATITPNAAMAMVDRLEADPYHDSARVEMFRLFDWMDKTDDVVIYLGDSRLNKILARKATYKRHMYMLMLGGMARYDLAHPNDKLETPEVDLEAGYACMCAGYRNLRQLHAVKKDRYYDRMCRAK